MVKGSKHSEEAKLKVGASKIGNKNCVGRVYSKETIQKMSESHKGNTVWLGKKHSDKTKKKLSELNINPSKEKRRKCGEANKGKRMGDKSTRWNPNLTDEERLDRRHYPAYNDWRKSVYERDLYTCQKCGDNKGGNLEAHHVESYAKNKELRTVVENGITFCRACHKSFHSIYGLKSNIEKVNEFMGRGH